MPLDPREYGMVDVESARAMQNEVKVIDLREVERRYLLTQANITLGKRSQALHVSGVLMAPQDTMTMLAQNGFFDMAIALGHAFDLDLQRVFETLTKKCLQVVSFYCFYLFSWKKPNFSLCKLVVYSLLTRLIKWSLNTARWSDLTVF